LSLSRIRDLNLAHLPGIILMEQEGRLMRNALHENVRRYFEEKELVDLTLAIVAINAWNRLAIAFRTPAGSYRPDLDR
jgi:hypothetical protein